MSEVHPSGGAHYFGLVIGALITAFNILVVVLILTGRIVY